MAKDLKRMTPRPPVSLPVRRRSLDAQAMVMQRDLDRIRLEIRNSDPAHSKAIWGHVWSFVQDAAGELGITRASLLKAALALILKKWGR